jgi:hypothetical protein
MVLRLRILKILAVLTAVCGFGVAGYAAANPGMAVCAALDAIPSMRLNDGTLVASDTLEPNQAGMIQRLLSDAKGRIGEVIGDPRSKPIVLFFDSSASFGPFQLNDYGMTQFVGSRTCIFIGPKGQNVDVIAHELVHAETADRVGSWARATVLPTWFDEGLAMQVDFRPEYEIQARTIVDSRYVQELRSARHFFASNPELLTDNYASAKIEVARWAKRVGYSSIYANLERIRQGEAFESVIAAN